MKQLVLLAFVSLLSFLGGLAMGSSSSATKSATDNKVPSALLASTPTPCPEQEEFPKLIDDSYVTKFNGTRLNLDYSSVQPVELPYAVDGSEIEPTNDGGLLVNFEDTLYRLDRHLRVMWKYRTAQLIIDYTYVESTKLIYGTAGDNVMFVLDANTGKQKAGESRNGSAAYGLTTKFGADKCLVEDYFRTYRERSRASGIEPMNDGISCWRGTTKLWEQDFPPDADAVVSGERIFAVTKSKKAIYVKEITPPPTKSE